jgi:hypothetical protein
MKRKANTECKSLVPRLQRRKGPSCEFFFFVVIKALNNSKFWPNSTRKKQFRNTNKQASKTPRSIKDKMLKIRRPKRRLSANSMQQEGGGGGGGEGEAMIVGTDWNAHRATGRVWTDRHSRALWSPGENFFITALLSHINTRFFLYRRVSIFGSSFPTAPISPLEVSNSVLFTLGKLLEFFCISSVKISAFFFFFFFQFLWWNHPLLIQKNLNISYYNYLLKSSC